MLTQTFVFEAKKKSLCKKMTNWQPKRPLTVFGFAAAMDQVTPPDAHSCEWVIQKLSQSNEI